MSGVGNIADYLNDILEENTVRIKIPCWAHTTNAAGSKTS